MVNALEAKLASRPSLLSHTMGIWTSSSHLLKNAEFENWPMCIQKASLDASFSCLVSECNNPGNGGTPNT